MHSLLLIFQVVHIEKGEKINRLLCTRPVAIEKYPV